MLLRLCFAVTFLVLAPSFSWGGVTFQAWQGASDVQAPSAGVISIYGGFVGADCPGSATQCDNCATAAWNTTDLAGGGCNNARIMPSTNLQLTFVSDEAAGRPILVNGTNNAVYESPSTVAKGSLASITVPWSTLCPYMFETGGTVAGSNTCISSNTDGILAGTGWKLGIDTNGSGTLTGGSISVSIYAVASLASTATSSLTNAQIFRSATCDETSTATEAGEGACDFTLYPGDGKAWITALQAPLTFPQSKGSTQFKAIRFLYVQGDWSSILPSSSSTDVTFTGAEATSDLALTSAFIDGLDNDRQYSFIIASVDQANNVGFFSNFDDTSFQTAAHQITPSQVLGILDKQFDCFIATAAYGSPFQAKVKTFRDFRDLHLMPHSLGRKVVKWYYRHSPKYAKIIATNADLRASARGLLWPLWAFASLALQFGLVWAIALSLVTIIGLGWIMMRITRIIRYRKRVS